MAHAAAVPGPGRACAPRCSTTSPGPGVHRVRLPPRLLGRRRARVPRLRHGRATRHRSIRPPGGRADAADQDVVPRRPDRRRDRRAHRTGPSGRVLAGRPATAAPARGHRAPAALAARLGPRRRPPHAARLDPAHRVVRAGRLAEPGSPDHGHRERVRPARGVAAGVLPASAGDPHHAVGARRGPDAPLHLHRRLRRVRDGRSCHHGGGAPHRDRGPVSRGQHRDGVRPAGRRLPLPRGPGRAQFRVRDPQ